MNMPQATSANSLSINPMIVDNLPVVTFADSEIPSILLADAGGYASRPFTLLRSSFQKKLNERGVRMIGITSATPDAGKSSLSIALASSLSKVADSPVLLVDLDLRRASIAEYLNLDITCGVGDYLADPAVDINKTGMRIADSNLAVLPTRPVATNSAELLSGPRFEEFISSLRGSDTQPICIFDLPPAFANDDTMISLENLDGYLLVVESGRTTKRHILDVLSMLSPSPCFGTILNRYQGSIGDSYGYGSAAYSRYYD